MGYQEKIDAIADKADQTAGDVSEAATKAAHRLKKDSEAVQRDISDRADAFSDETSESIRKVRKDAKSLRAAVDDVFVTMEKDLATLVRKRPMTSLAAAALFGFIFGRINRR
jgi:ElaB/YqjD/DUF883 family membrane-anchored ribosome-binding protein